MTNTITNVQLITIFEAINQTTGTVKEVLESIASKRLFIDNHNDDIVEANKDRLSFLLLQGSNGQEYVCPAYKNSRFCMNEMYKDDETGYAHLSRFSVAGLLGRCADDYELVQSCDEYNKEKVCGPSIKAVIEL